MELHEENSFNCVKKYCQVDRSPTGSGVTARIALQYHKGLIQLNRTRTFKSGATGSLFTGKPVEVPDYFFCVLEEAASGLRSCRYRMATSTTQEDRGFVCKYMVVFVFCSGDKLWRLQGCSGGSRGQSFLYWSFKLCARRR